MNKRIVFMNKHIAFMNKHIVFMNKGIVFMNKHIAFINKIILLLHFSGAINLRKIGMARRGAKDTEEEENRYAGCYACVKIRKSCVAD